MINANWTITGKVYSNGSTSYNATNGVTSYGPYTVYHPGVVRTIFIRNGFSVSTPGFKRLKRRKLPDNPHSRGIADASYDEMALSAYVQQANGSWTRDTYRGPSKHFGANVEQQLEPDDPYNVAVNRLFGELSQTSGSLAVSLAEAGKTADHIANTATRLYKAFRGLRRGRFDEFTSALGMTVSQKEFKRVNKKISKVRSTKGDMLNFAAGTWLEYTYGWKPLIQDIYSQAENLANYYAERQNVVRRGRGSAKTKLDKFLVSSTLGLGYPGKVTTRIQAVRRCSVVVKYKIDTNQTNLLNTFGINNPLLVAWEVVPFSFVVDWVLPIGTFLESLTSTLGLTFHSGTIATRTNYDISSVCEADGKTSPNFPKSTWTGAGGGKQQKMVKNRVLITSFPSVPLPKLKDPRSFAHLASALSLLQVIFGKR